MTNQTLLDNSVGQMRDAVAAGLRTIADHSAPLLFTGAGLLAIAALTGQPIPPEFAPLAGLVTGGVTVGGGVLANVLVRIMRKEKVPEEDVRRALERALTEYGGRFEGLLIEDAFQRALAQQLVGLHLLEALTRDNQTVIVDKLSQQAARYHVFADEMRDEFAEVKHILGTLATSELVAEVGRKLDDALSLPAHGEQSVTQNFGTMLGGQAIGIQHVHPLAPVQQSLHQLPAAPGDFTGREEELRELREKIWAAAGSGAAVIVGLRGMGGVGKTALAIKLGLELRASYPDAQFFFDLRGASEKVGESGAMVREALEHVIRGFIGLEAKLPEDEAGLAGLYRSLLDGKRALLLMDNARSAEQVAQLVPPVGCLLLLTSRWSFFMPGLQCQDLDALNDADARALLLKIDERIGDDAAAVAVVCVNLPLALTLAGRWVREHRTLEAMAYVTRCQDVTARLRLSGVGATLEVSYQALGETEGGEALQLCWLALATFPETFDRSGAAAVSGLLEGPNNINDLEIVLEMIDDQLIELVNSSLVQWDETRQWYRLHDMAREFARKRQSPTQWEAFARRHSAHYCQLLATANRFYLTGNDDVENGLALFDLERRNIEAGQAWAAQRVEVDDSAASLCSEYANAGGDILDLRLDRREYIRWLENALMAARRLNNRNAQGAHMGNLGNIYMDLGEPESAVELNVQHASLARETGDELGEGAALGNLGNAYAAMGETQSAINFYQQYLAIARKIGNRRGEGIVIGNLGSAYAALGETRVAIMYHEKALVIAREIGDRRGEATEVGNLGLAFASLNGIERAVDHHEQALAIARALGDRSEEARTLFNLSDAYTAIGETQSAISLKEQYLAIAHELGDRRGEGNAHWQIALALEMLGKRENAIESAESALKIYDAIEPQNAIAVRKILKEWTRDQRGERPSG